MTDEAPLRHEPVDDNPVAEEALEMPIDVPGLTDDALQQFWRVARSRAGVGNADVYLGVPWGEAVPPPAWSFGDSPAVADELVELVLAGKKRATTGVKQEYDDQGEPLPRVGELSIIVDGSGTPRVLVRETEVRVVPFGEVTPGQAAAEGEGDLTLEWWRQTHRDVFARYGYPVDDDTLVVWERFDVLYPTR
jgi:uncharacterized protein YhfF